jgi:hypothetical protein
VLFGQRQADALTAVHTGLRNIGMADRHCRVGNDMGPHAVSGRWSVLGSRQLRAGSEARCRGIEENRLPVSLIRTKIRSRAAALGINSSQFPSTIEQIETRLLKKRRASISLSDGHGRRPLTPPDRNLADQCG